MVKHPARAKKKLHLPSSDISKIWAYEHGYTGPGTHKARADGLKPAKLKLSNAKTRVAPLGKTSRNYTAAAPAFIAATPSARQHLSHIPPTTANEVLHAHLTGNPRHHP